MNKDHKRSNSPNRIRILHRIPNHLLSALLIEMMKRQEERPNMPASFSDEFGELVTGRASSVDGSGDIRERRSGAVERVPCRGVGMDVGEDKRRCRE